MMTDEEREVVLDRAEKDLRAAGFDNVVILTNKGGFHGTIGIAGNTKLELMSLLMASYFMDYAMVHMLKEDSPGRAIWKALLQSILEAIVPRIPEMEEGHRDENRVSKIVSFGKGPEVKE